MTFQLRRAARAALDASAGRFALMPSATRRRHADYRDAPRAAGFSPKKLSGRFDHHYRHAATRRLSPRPDGPQAAACRQEPRARAYDAGAPSDDAAAGPRRRRQAAASLHLTLKAGAGRRRYAADTAAEAESTAGRRRRARHFAISFDERARCSILANEGGHARPPSMRGFGATNVRTAPASRGRRRRCSPCRFRA